MSEKTCNVLFLCTGNPARMTAHWGVPDPADFKGSEAEKAAFYGKVMRMPEPRK